MIAISRRVGADPALVQGTGGNTSVKTADRVFMYIKASGTPLKKMSTQRGWRRLRLASLLALLQEEEFSKKTKARSQTAWLGQLLACCEDEQERSLRPSVETCLHALLDRYVIHLHPVSVNAYLCAKEGKQVLLRRCEKAGLAPLWVPSANPGYDLAKRAQRLLENYRQRQGRPPEVLFLANHGVFFSAETSSSALALMHKVIVLCEQGLKPMRTGQALCPTPDKIRASQFALRKALVELYGGHLRVKYIREPIIASFLSLPQAKSLATLPPLTPEEQIYLGKQLVWVERGEAFKEAAQRLKRSSIIPPICFLVDGVGLFLVSPDERSAQIIKEVVLASLAVRIAARQFGGPRPLPRSQRKLI